MLAASVVACVLGGMVCLMLGVFWVWRAVWLVFAWGMFGVWAGRLLDVSLDESLEMCLA